MATDSYYAAHIFCCTNRRPDGHARGCCASKGAENLRDYMKARVKELGISDVRVNTAGCLDRCENGPCMVIYPEAIWYSCKTREDVDHVIKEHLLHHSPVQQLQLPKKTS